ncbi:hypothetical protein WICMUC_005713 [Wickerhamomyces mucosus]|uniref:Uncharacterized protein n=1 Tax=Wickerhamomyces mucosus TaxID=1378264 RepID=A0A9P8T528_9ASCO|nr:hypothetical protein WICMUC_005713 [Wickerhamomyces mucosus]
MSDNPKFLTLQEVLKLIQLKKCSDFNKFKTKMMEFEAEVAKKQNDSVNQNLHLFSLQSEFVADKENNNVDFRGIFQENIGLDKTVKVHEEVLKALNCLDIDFHREIINTDDFFKFLRSIKIFLNTGYSNPLPLNITRAAEIPGTTLETWKTKPIPNIHLVNFEDSEDFSIDPYKIYYYTVHNLEALYHKHQELDSKFFSYFGQMVLGTEVIKREADLSFVVRAFLKTILEYINTIMNGDLKITSGDSDTRECHVIIENIEAYEASITITSKTFKDYKREILNGPLESKLMIIPDLVIKNAGLPIIPIELKYDKYLNKRYLEYKKDLTSHDVLNEGVNFQKEFLIRHGKILEYFQQSISQMISYNSMISILTNGISWIILRDDKQFSEKPFAFTLTQQQRTSKTEVGLLLENYFTMIILQVYDAKFNQKLIATIMQQIDSNSIMNMENQI